MLLHLLVVRPLLTSPPINQVLATGGVLFVLQGAATLVFSTDFRSLGVDMPPMEVGEVFVSGTKLAAFSAALLGAGVLWAFLKFTYVGTAIRAIARDREVMPLMGVDPQRIYLIASAVGGALAGLAACLLVVQLDVHPFVGLSFGPITFMICVMGGLGNMLGGFLAAFLMGLIISVGGFWGTTEFSYVSRLRLLHRHHVRPAAGVVRPMKYALPGALLCRRSRRCRCSRRPTMRCMSLITIVLTALAGTGWAMMGRYGLVSFGHGAFLGAAAYTMALLWNAFGLTPWMGIPIGVAVAVLTGHAAGLPSLPADASSGITSPW